MSRNRNIGRVLSVDNFRVYIKIDDDLHGTYKSGVHDIYEIARINSYLILPVGSDRVVALITRVSMREEYELEKNMSSIKLPTSSRYISATMLGTITKREGHEKFIQGVYSFPSLDNPVWYVTEKDLNHIFDDKHDREKIEYDKDFYLPIGTSPAFPGYSVKICPDQFFVKHAAILGNTGSGKSCTFTSIIKNLFEYNYNGKRIENAHFIVFDTNGEYKDAFLPANIEQLIDPKDKNRIKQINAYYYGGDENVKVPYWYMNWEDINYLLKPSEGTQAPVLNRAIGLSKNYPIRNAQSKSKIEILQLEHLETLYNLAKSGDWWKANSLEASYNTFKMNLPPELQRLNLGKQAPCPTPDEIQKIDAYINEERKINEAEQILNEQNIDMPIWFDYLELCTKFIDAAIEQEGRTNNRINEYLATLRLRMNSFFNDKRMAIPLMLKNNVKDDQNILYHFMAFLLGDFNRYYGNQKTNSSFINTYNIKNKPHNNNKTSQITIIDTSQLPFEVLETITAILGRLILEFVSYLLPEQRGKYPIVIVLEEAQNYISEKRDSIAKTVFERIAREGRKYGISLVVCSQRPSELSKTVLSQCNSFIIHRLQNPEDQSYIRGLISSANADILDQLPIIPQQHAIITGDCVRTPIQVCIDNVNPTPNSHNPKYVERWLDVDFEIPYEDTCKRWAPVKIGTTTQGECTAEKKAQENKNTGDAREE